MNYADLPKGIQNKVLKIVAIINNIEIEPMIRQRYMEQLMSTVNTAMYNKIYEMNAWDMLIDHTTGKSAGASHYGASKVMAGAPVTNIDIATLVATNNDLIVGKAQNDAFDTARESGKVPQMKRSTISHNPCIWCKNKDTRGSWINYPDREDFRRHANCSCAINTQGYNSRNGLLNNYVKKKKQ